MLRNERVLPRNRGHLLSLLTRPALLALGWSALALPSSGSSLLAQDRDRDHLPPGPLILELLTSTRALALGGAFWIGSGAHAVFHHPALISGQSLDFSLGGSYRGDGDNDRHERDGDSREHDRQGFGSDDDDSNHARHDAIYMALSASGAWLGGTVAVGLAVFDYGAGRDFDVPERGRTPSERDRSDAVGRSWPGATEFVGTVGYAREVFGFDVGAAAKLVGQSLAGSRGRTVAADFGVARGIGPVSAALTVQNLGPDLGLGDGYTPLPKRVVLGAGTQGRRPVGPLDIGGAVQVAREGGGEIVPGGGVEIAYWPIVRRVFIVRLGAARVVEGDGLPVTFGAGFEGDRVRVDYSFSEHEPMVGAHRVGISIR